MIPVSEPFLDESDREAVADAMRRGALSGHMGDYIVKFEQDFSTYCGVSQGIATNNGTASIHLILAALGIGPGDEVLVSTYTNMATFFAVLYQGATPVPIDIERDTWNLNPNLLERAVTSRTRAIIPVHIFGHPVDMDPVLEFANAHKLLVIEDAAQSHGALYLGKKTGSLSDAASFSFYSNKIITTGEGGMVVTDNAEIADRCRSFRNLCYGRGADRFLHEAIGFNYRMSGTKCGEETADRCLVSGSVARQTGISTSDREALGPECLLDVSSSADRCVPVRPRGRYGKVERGRH